MHSLLLADKLLLEEIKMWFNREFSFIISKDGTVLGSRVLTLSYDSNCFCMQLSHGTWALLVTTWLYEYVGKCDLCQILSLDHLYGPCHCLSGFHMIGFQAKHHWEGINNLQSKGTLGSYEQQLNNKRDWFTFFSKENLG